MVNSTVEKFEKGQWRRSFGFAKQEETHLRSVSNHHKNGDVLFMLPVSAGGRVTL